MRPDAALSNAIASTTAALAQAAQVAVHTGPVYCTDSILAQFGKLDYITQELGCIGIEYGDRRGLQAAGRVGIWAAALFSVSDVPVRRSCWLLSAPEEKNSAAWKPAPRCWPTRCWRV